VVVLVDSFSCARNCESSWRRRLLAEVVLDGFVVVVVEGGERRSMELGLVEDMRGFGEEGIGVDSNQEF
jgi:hypothetical protein